MNSADLQNKLHGSPTRIHLIGVAGSGMSGIAALLLALGHRVSGADRATTAETGRLQKKGLDFYTPHCPEALRDVELVIYSSAIKPGNPDYDEARKLEIPMFRRADALAAIMAGKKGIVVAGMHGKTTTSAMAAHVLRVCGIKPSHYVGAEIPILGSNARWDSEGEYFVAEGDESDGTLINYHPEHAIVLNIEPEHLDFYRDIEAIDAVYTRLVSQTNNHVFYCGDDPGASRVCASHPGAISYGFDEGNQFHIRELDLETTGTGFTVFRDGVELGECDLSIPGRHNALNATAVVALATELGLDFPDIARALENFRGARRRFEVKYETPEHVIVDDYGHHPSEIRATLATALQTGRKRIVVAFQPHRYSRTQRLRKEFGQAFGDADAVFVSDVYPASEKPIPGVSGLMIVEELRGNGHPSANFHAEIPSMHTSVGNALEEGDLLLTLGAGNIHEVGTQLAKDLELRRTLLDIMGDGAIKLYEPLSNHTTMRVGGPAQFWAEPATEEGFAELVSYCFDEEIPFMVMGRGSNLLVRDGGIPGVVAHLSRGEFSRIETDGDTITAGVGVKFKQLANAARKAGIGGFGWMEGIPGNLGGGLRMNAGAMGVQTFDQVRHVRFIDQDGNLFTRTPADMDVAYRHVATLENNYAVSALLKGHPASPEEIDRELDESQTKRKETQPIAACAGCIFKNPADIPAGKLVEELGFKNFVVGKARVSEVHGNFIVNDGGATATEILTLIDEIRAAADRDRGILLETEVQIVGVDTP